jgi:hypothetical protein
VSVTFAAVISAAAMQLRVGPAQMAATLLLVLSSYWMWRRRKALLLKHSAR